MALDNLASIGNVGGLSDLKKVQDYLYKLQEELKYTLENLTPEDNFTEKARLQIITKDNVASAIEQSTEGIKLSVEMQGEALLALKLTVDGIELSAVKKDELIGEINSKLTITGNRINLSTGHFTISSNNITVDENGNATFSGTVQGAAITVGGNNNVSGTLTVKNASGGTIGTWNKDGIRMGDFRVNTRGDILQCDNVIISQLSSYGEIEVQSDGTHSTVIRGARIDTDDIYCEYIEADEIIGVAGDSYSSDGFTIGEYLDWIYERI